MTKTSTRDRVAAAEAAREQLANYRFNDPDVMPAGLPRLLEAAKLVLADVTAETARDLASLQSSLQEIEIRPERDSEFELRFLRFQATIDQARRAAIGDGYPAGPEDGGLPPAGMIPRLRLDAEVAALSREVGDLRVALAEIRALADRDANRPEQQAIVGVLVKKVDVKLALIDVKIGSLIDVPGLSDAARAALRLTKAFVATVRSANARVADWLRDRAMSVLLPAATRMADKVQDLLAAAARPAPPASPARDEIVFDVVEAERMINRGEEPPDAVRPYLTSLDLWGKASLAIAARLPALQKLKLRNVHNAGPLASARTLRALNMSDCFLSDLAPLSGLTSLQSLSLDFNILSDVGPLSGLTSLQSLSLEYNDMSDVGPLSDLTSLQSLSLSGNSVSDVGPLSGLTSLQSLSLANTQVSDVGPLSGLTALQSLSLDNTQVSDVGPLSGLTALQSLSLDNTQVSDVGPLSGLTALQSLSLDNARVSNVSPLSGLTSLQSLSLDDTQVSNVGPLLGLKSLQSLSMKRTKVSNIGKLAVMPGITIHVEDHGTAERLAATTGGRLIAVPGHYQGMLQPAGSTLQSR